MVQQLQRRHNGTAKTWLFRKQNPYMDINMTHAGFSSLPEGVVRYVAQFLPISTASKAEDLEPVLSSPFPYQKLELHVTAEFSLLEKERIKYLLKTRSAGLKVFKLTITGELDPDLLIICSMIDSIESFELVCIRQRLENLLVLSDLLEQAELRIQRVTIFRSELHDRQMAIFGQSLNKVLLHNSNIQSLCLNWGSIDDEGLCLFADSLAKNTTLEFLQISYNKITSKGAGALCQALLRNHKLQVLDLGYNDIDDAISEDLYLALTCNNTLRSLSFQNNKLGVITARRLSDALMGNQSIEVLNLGYNNIGDEVGIIFASVIGVNRHLQVLNLNGNEIRLRGGTALGEGIKRNKGLRQLFLRLNSIHGEGKKTLSAAKNLHRHLRCFDMLRTQL